MNLLYETRHSDAGIYNTHWMGFNGFLPFFDKLYS